MPMVPAADTARAVIGPDGPAAARIVVVGIAAVIVAPVEMAVAVVRAIDPVAMKTAMTMKAAVVAESAIAQAAAVKCRRGAETAAMETTAAKAAEMSATAMEATATAEAAAAVKTSAVSATTTAMANLRDEVVGRSFRRG